MFQRSYMHWLLIGAFGFALVGCENLPGTRQQQATAVGGAAGAAAGAAVAGPEHRILGAILGGALGAGGGYVIAANTGALRDEDSEGAAQAAQRAEQNPASAEDARRADTADLNNDGFVTLDEVLAMDEAGLSEREMIRRMEATDQVFELTQDQVDYLVEEGVSRNVVTEMNQINRDLVAQDRRQDVISQPRSYGSP